MSCGIYKFLNDITKEVYIGLSVNIEERYKHHMREYLNGTTKFYKGILQYGVENFRFEIVELCHKDLLNEREIYWIDFYDSFNNGYNSTLGGSNKNSIDEENILDLYNKGFTPKEIQKKLNIGLTTVYKYLTLSPKFLENKNKNLIYLYDLEGIFIQAWDSCKEAERELNINASAIGKVISGQRLTAGGFIWRNYYKLQLTDIAKNNIRKKKKVYLYDLSLNLVREFNSITEAAKSVNGNFSLIKRVCEKGLEYSAYGYKWSFDII